MKLRSFILAAVIAAAFFLPVAVSSAFAADVSKTLSANWCLPYPDLIKPGVAGINLAPSLLIMPPPGLPEAPVEHTDGRLNYRDCRAPLAVYLDDAGDVEVWTTDENNMYVKLDLVLSATADEIADALALALETGEDVVIDGYVDGFALIAKLDGTLKAELIGVYGFDFKPDGSDNTGFGLPPVEPEPPFVIIDELLALFGLE